MLEAWTTVLRGTFEQLLLELAAVIPNLLLAIVLLILGWVVGAGLGRLVARAAHSLKIDDALRAASVDKVVTRAGFHFSSGGFLGGLVKWFIIAIFFVVALDILNLNQVNVFLSEVVFFYLPQVIVAVLILLVGAVVAEFVKNVATGAAQAADIGSPYFVGSVARWSIWIFAVLAALDQLSVASAFVQTLFTGIVVAISLALGLAFGLGGRDAAARYIDRVQGELSKRHHDS